MKKVEVFKKENIPNKNNKLLGYDVSEWYFAKCLSIGGDEVNCMVIYDFKNSKWCFSRSGINELIEYYIIC